MGLTVGGDPFGPSRTGRFDFPAPAEVVYTRPLGRRVRGVVAGRVMIDTEEAHLVWRTGSLPTYAFPGPHLSNRFHLQAKDRFQMRR